MMFILQIVFPFKSEIDNKARYVLGCDYNDTIGVDAEHGISMAPPLSHPNVVTCDSRKHKQAPLPLIFCRAKCWTLGFKTAVHKPMSDITMAVSTSFIQSDLHRRGASEAL